ncbi:uncharacterized protein L969DRAFT_15765 [Mixia osmundae IAM 14324]|uniref:uncharacterized protein n=1 Tax=Mixia osmundae (strain CBS 9802 / IAM 14324 / JCM 22182 / KY 12970) TaxID=764103 RepID=UPI0004A54D51|nr:uncharacterized protein L969DRAFT_15765 [Mixia osmundae IAM 14324]KEI41749.1 hypothetical protein L969DRAFT_15765 [Mixia osmundae IAM 14324]
MARPSRYERSTGAAQTNGQSLSASSLLAWLAVYVGVLCYVAQKLHYALPTPNQALVSPVTGHSQFSEARALDVIKYLSEDVGYRIVGTKQMVEAVDYLLEQVRDLQRQLAASPLAGMHQIEVWHQKDDGAHLFDFMNKKVWKKYYQLDNVIVRLSDGTEESKRNAILVNSHLDSTLPSPGAADDGAGVGVMLETLRVMSSTDRRLYNSIVFLFNGAEESLQDASHLFITKHPLRHSIRAVINLEACGVAGPEILFQATSTKMVQAYSHVPYPYATVIASEIFSSGIILSDTDFRQFETYGNLTGLDMALVQDSYKYHTRLDVVEYIEPGALQHMGENTIAMLNWLTSQDVDISDITHSKDSVFFSALGGKVFVLFSKDQAAVGYSMLAALAVVTMSAKVRWQQKAAYALMTASIPISLLSGIVAANVVAVIQGNLLGRALSWFRHEHLCIYLFSFPALLGVTLVQHFTRRLAIRRGYVTHGDGTLEHAALVGTVTYYTVAALIGHSAGILSAYLFALSAAWALLVVVLNDYLLAPASKQGSRVANSAYFLGQLLPAIVGTEGLIGFLDLFVPLTGRVGADAPVDNIIATITSAVGIMCFPMLIPLMHRFGGGFIKRLWLFAIMATVTVIIVFSQPGWVVFTPGHPKRIFVLHMENTTTSPPAFALHTASADRAPFFKELVEEAARAVDIKGATPVMTDINDYVASWDVTYPVSQFLLSYEVPLPPAPASYHSPWAETFKIYAKDSRLNAVKQQRSLTIVIDHPGIIWSVIAFDGDVVAWDLPSPAERGHVRHHVKEASSYGNDKWTLDLTLQLDQPAFEAAQRQSQRLKGQRGDVSEADEALASLRIDFSGLDEQGMHPATSQNSAEKPGVAFFHQLDAALPANVDAMLLTAVGGVVRI